MSLFSVIWEQLSLKDMFDMAVVAVVIYQFMLIIKGTRAVQILLGMALLSLLFALGINYKLHSLNWLLAHFFDSFFIIVVILFQDQIRSTLASLASRGKIFGGISREELEMEIDEIVEACTILSKEKVGALFAIERTNGLSNYMETGTEVNSKIHKDMLYAVFQSKGPLHDGAIIIAGGVIGAVGCFLPLSKATEIDRKLGTRHRAAMGLTEVTDAVVVVVSEERGSISVCVGGEFFDCPEPKKLRLYLKHLWSNNGLAKNLIPELKQNGAKN